MNAEYSTFLISFSKSIKSNVELGQSFANLISDSLCEDEEVEKNNRIYSKKAFLAVATASFDLLSGQKRYLTSVLGHVSGKLHGKDEPQKYDESKIISLLLGRCKARKIKPKGITTYFRVFLLALSRAYPDKLNEWWENAPSIFGKKCLPSFQTPPESIFEFNSREDIEPIRDRLIKELPIKKSIQGGVPSRSDYRAVSEKFHDIFNPPVTIRKSEADHETLRRFTDSNRGAISSLSDFKIMAETTFLQHASQDLFNQETRVNFDLVLKAYIKAKATLEMKYGLDKPFSKTAQLAHFGFWVSREKPFSWPANTSLVYDLKASSFVLDTVRELISISGIQYENTVVSQEQITVLNNVMSTFLIMANYDSGLIKLEDGSSFIWSKEIKTIARMIYEGLSQEKLTPRGFEVLLKAIRPISIT